MKLKLNLSRPDGSHSDLHVTVDADCKIGDLADRLALSDPNGSVGTGVTLLRADRSGSVTLDRRTAVFDSGIRSGISVALAKPPSNERGSAGSAAVLTVHVGPDAGRTFELKDGPNTVGRGRQCSVRMSDPMVSTLHARVIVADTIEIIDANSSNGILMGGQQVSRVELTPDDQVLLGDNLVSVRAQRASITNATGQADIQFNRSPRVDPIYKGVKLVAPDPPKRLEPQRFPFLSMLMPLLMLVGLVAVMSVVSKGGGMATLFIFMFLSPLMVGATWFENRRQGKKAFEEAVKGFRASLADLLARGRSAQDHERARRLVEHPGTSDVVNAIASRDVLLWTRRPEHESFMELRFGLGTQTSRIEIDVQPARESPPELIYELEDVTSQFHTIDRVPVVASFDRSGSIGISGPDEGMLAVARGVVLQMVGMHAPSEVVLCGVASLKTAARWDWLKWLPHTSSEHSPLSGPHLASTPPGCMNLVAELDDVIAARYASKTANEPVNLPRVLVLVEDDAPVDRNRLVNIAEIGPPVGVHCIWVAASTTNVPAACRSFLEIDRSDGSAATGRVVEAEYSRPVLVEPVNESDAIQLARSVAPVVDSGALADDQSDLPSSVSFLGDAGVELADSSSAVLERWRESQSVFPPAEFPIGAQRPAGRRQSSLRALVGRGKGDNVYLDLRAVGPHALVGGTTGSGKSEFLQSWVMGMATAHGPQRVTFLFVDYKGGAAFADCVNLPHCVGLVTDLSPLLVRRALTSLRAELTYREHLLNRYSAKDLLELEKSGNPETPPSLIIIVDEFAALVQEVPEFVDGVVDVAQRGRSLGLHLILATQRPAGVIKDNLRANTNLRIALRMADEDDSSDVVGTKVAGSFDPALPGRSVAKTGPGRLTMFQAGYLGGWTRSDAPPPTISVETLDFASPLQWEIPESLAPKKIAETGPNDIQRVVGTVVEASRQAALPAPRKPWLPELAEIYDLGKLQLPRRDTDLTFGVIDAPQSQAQHIVSFHPDEDGNMAVYGTGGTGKSTFLRTLAVSAGLTLRGGPCVVYGLDFGSRGLSMLETLPQVGSIIPADDGERIARLLTELRATVDERAIRYAEVRAGTIGEYRAAADKPDEPRVLLLLDGMAAFRNTYEVGADSYLLELLESIAADGRQVGVHLVVTADRSTIIPSALHSSIQKNLVLRLTGDTDLVSLGAPQDGFTRETPAGRGFLDQQEVQVAVFGGTRNVALQAKSIEKLAARLRREGVAEAPKIGKLPDHVELATLPNSIDKQGRAAVGGDETSLVVFGLTAETLGPIGFDSTLPFVIAGPPRSGRSTALLTAVQALRRTQPASEFALFGQRRSPLLSRPGWAYMVDDPDEADDLAERLTKLLRDAGESDHRLVVVIEGVGEYSRSMSSDAVVELVEAARKLDLPVVAEGETSDLKSYDSLASVLRRPGQGVILQPEQMDGDSLFDVEFPRVARKDFPVGRGMYVNAGHFSRVQVAVS